MSYNILRLIYGNRQSKVPEVWFHQVVESWVENGAWQEGTAV